MTVIQNRKKLWSSKTALGAGFCSKDTKGIEWSKLTFFIYPKNRVDRYQISQFRTPLLKGLQEILFILECPQGPFEPLTSETICN